MDANALSGVKILDVSHYIAGPYCTKLLTELGAEVIKIERPGQGDPARRMRPFFREGPINENSGLFLFLNANKRGITLDLKQSEGKRIFRELVRQVDVVVENFSPRVMPALGLDYAALKKANPNLIMTSISNFGQTGPYRDWKSSDLVIHAMSGVGYACYGLPEKPPIKPFGSMSDHVAGLYACIGTLLSWYRRGSNGAGQHVDISILECYASVEEHALIMSAYKNEIRKRTGGRHPTNHPMTIRPCKDGYMAVTLSGSVQWQNLCLIAGLPEEWSADDSPFLDGLYRRDHYQEINDALDPWLMSHTREELQAMAWEVFVPFASLKTVKEAVGDPQYEERGFFVEAEHPYAGKVKIPGVPYMLPENPAQVRRAPLLGEHNEEIYCGQLGFSKEELDRLRRQQVI